MDLKVNHNLLKKVGQKLNRQNRKLNLKNKKVFQLQMKNILTLKRSNLDQVDVTGQAKFNFLINQNTFNSHQTVGYLLALIQTYQQAFPFLDIHLSHRTPNKVIVHFSWEAYRNALESDLLEKTLGSVSDSSITQTSLQEQLPGVSGVTTSLQELDLDNANRLQQEISRVLDHPLSEHLGHPSQDFRIRLRPKSFEIESSANFLQTKMLNLKRQYPFIELYHLTKNVVILRVYWNLYRHLLTKGRLLPMKYGGSLSVAPSPVVEDRPVRLEEDRAPAAPAVPAVDQMSEDEQFRQAILLSQQEAQRAQAQQPHPPVHQKPQQLKPAVIPPGYLAEHLTAQYLQQQRRSPYQVHQGGAHYVQEPSVPPYGGLGYFPGYPALGGQYV